MAEIEFNSTHEKGKFWKLDKQIQSELQKDSIFSLIIANIWNTLTHQL